MKKRLLAFYVADTREKAVAIFYLNYELFIYGPMHYINN